MRVYARPGLRSLAPINDTKSFNSLRQQKHTVTSASVLIHNTMKGQSQVDLTLHHKQRFQFVCIPK